MSDPELDSDPELAEDYHTIPTQPIARSVSPTARESQYITQPTQIVPGQRVRSSSPPIVQVAASSPAPKLAYPHNGPSTAPLSQGGLSRGFANSIAPPGTHFRPPASQWTQSQAPIDISSDEEAGKKHNTDSSDDELTKRSGGIKPSVFVRNGVPVNSQGVKAPRVEESPVKSDLSPLGKKRTDFRDFASSFAFNSASSLASMAASTKRTADAMADAYANGRPVKAQRQDVPARAQPVAVEMSLNDIDDYYLRQNVKNMRTILPQASVRQCFEALKKCRGNESAALGLLGDWLEKEEAKSQTPKFDVQKSDDELLDTKKPARSFKKPTTKRTVDNKQSIRDKYVPTEEKSSTIHDELEDLKDFLGEPDKPRSARRRLIQGRRAPGDTPPPVPAKSRDRTQTPPPATKQSALKSASRSDDEASIDSDDSGIEAGTDPELEIKVLSFINDGSVEELVKTSEQPQENVDAVVEQRPFDSLAAIRAVSFKKVTGKTKTGKDSTRTIKAGDRLVDVCIEVFSGYEAVDALVARCEDLGKPIAAEMQKWGSKSSSEDGELELTDLEGSVHDSGIGTPLSSLSADEGDGVEKKARRKKGGFLPQPKTMGADTVLKDYQVVGLNWLNFLYSKKLSCILADDMGLGKTIQVIAFLTHLKEIGEKGPHLIVVPGSTLENWLREFQKHSPKLAVEPYYAAQNERVSLRMQLLENLKNIDVVVTTYDTASKPDDTTFLRRIRPKVCVYDEGHALKNSGSKRYSQLMKIAGGFRLLLTGTPLQNNLQELVSLLAFMMPELFSERRDDLQFIFKYRAKTTDADHDALLSAERISRARSMMTPFVLRRKKHQVLKHLPKKTCRVEYVDLTPEQRTIYDEEVAKMKHDLFLQKQATQADAPDEQPEPKAEPGADAKGGKKDAFQLMKAGKQAKKKKDREPEALPTPPPAPDPKPDTRPGNHLMSLRKAALHPLLFRRRYSEATLTRMFNAHMKWDPTRDRELVWDDLVHRSDFDLHKLCADELAFLFAKFLLPDSEQALFIDSSAKVTALIALLRQWIPTGAKTLVFSQFTSVLDLLEYAFEEAGIAFCRLDGSTDMAARQELIDAFHADEALPVFMLSTKAGGAGINLACATKVVIFDAGFNPQEEVQAENRAHRVGQTREVEVVRLVARGTVEEKMLKLGEGKLLLDAAVAGEEGEGAAGESEGDAEERPKGKVEEKGVEIVEEMLLDSLGVSEDEGGGTKGLRAGKGDIRDDFMKGLKKAGLNMAAEEDAAA